jgi:hypothetical protein
MGLVRAHKDLNDMPVAIIDIHNPEVSDQADLKVLSDFDQLDDLLESCQ